MKLSKKRTGRFDYNTNRILEEIIQMSLLYSTVSLSDAVGLNLVTTNTHKKIMIYEYKIVNFAQRF